MNSSYEKTMETRVVRITHKVRFRIGESVNSIINTLQRVPPYLCLREIDSEDETHIVFEFLEEKPG